MLEDELKDPVAVDILKTLEKRCTPLKIESIDLPPSFNVMIPTINPELIFGGYIGLFNFIEFLINREYKVRILVCEDIIPPIQRIISKLGEDNVVSRTLNHCEIVPCFDRSLTYSFGRDDIFIGYSWLTMRLAHLAAATLNGNRSIFFIQEFEPIFHHYDSLRFLAQETYTYPHNAVFNSPQLARYFESNELGVFNQKNQGDHCIFKHAISQIKPPSLEDIKQRPRKKVLLYARPERHAGRNMFEVSILALKEAIRQQIFDTSTWDFYGIGSLEKISKKLFLTDNIELKLLQKMSYSEYTTSLSQYDIGISLMYAPHPSVPPLEMASAGMLTITTTFENRTASEMTEISANIISADHTVASIVESIRLAVSGVDDYQSRCDNAKINWPTSWDQSFDENFHAAFDGLNCTK